jgi:hypothetical protein
MMSLINEALKKAEREKRANGAPFATYAAMKECVVAPPARKRRGRLARGAVLLSVPAVCVAVYLAVGAVTDGGPRAATASVGLPEAAGGLLVTVGEGGADMTIATPSTPAGTVRPTRGTAAAQTGMVVASVPGEPDAATEAPAPEAAPPAKPAAPTEAAGSAKVVEAPQPAKAPAPARDDFKLTAIMRGPEGATAIINGQFVGVGDTVGDAKIVRIGTHTVDLQAGEAKLSIQM